MATFPLAVRNAMLDAHNAKVLARIASETATEAPRAVRGATAAGDEARLRGVPAVGPGVAGAIRGTRPGENLR